MTYTYSNLHLWILTLLLFLCIKNVKMSGKGKCKILTLDYLNSKKA